jgi:hypothetical protein
VLGSATVPSCVTIANPSIQLPIKVQQKIEKPSILSQVNTKLLDGLVQQVCCPAIFNSHNSSFLGQVAVQKARDVKFMKKITSKYMLRQGIKANKLFKSRGRDDQ